MAGHFDPNFMTLEDLSHATSQLHLIDQPTPPLLPLDTMQRALDLMIEASRQDGRVVDRKSLAWGIAVGVMAERVRQARQPST